MNGVLVVDKPAGPSSHDVVARIRRTLRTPAVGHTGTLDPLASGVLPLVVGKATRLARFLSADDKEYVAHVQFGVATSTFDAEERPAEVEVPDLTRAAVESLLNEFRGTYRQLPPAFSAKKIRGQPAYRLARARQPVEVLPVEVTVSALELQSFEHGMARLRVVASSGFYVRVLAHDLGQRAGCGAHLAALRRIRAGEFSLADAVSLDVAEREGTEAGRRLIGLERLLPHLPAAVLNERGLWRAAHGNLLSSDDFLRAPDPAQTSRVRLFDPAGSLLAIAEPRGGGVLHPSVVLG